MDTTDHTIKKPTVFISHATSDAEFANAIKAEIEKVFANGIHVYCTSSPGTIMVGNDWLLDIEEKLNTAQAVIAIITPISVEKSWLWFEIGATWLKSRNGNCRIYPLCAPEVDLSELPSPLDRLQALSMGKTIDLKLMFEQLIKQFGFGNISTFRATNITKRIPKYRSVKIHQVDLDERTLYSGKYAGYSDEELMEVLDTEMFFPDSEIHPLFSSGREGRIENGKLLHFKHIDRSLELPPGTAKRLLKQVALRYTLEPSWEADNSIRFKKKSASGNRKSKASKS